MPSRVVTVALATCGTITALGNCKSGSAGSGGSGSVTSGPAALRQCRPDPAQADDAERLAVQVLAEIADRFPGLPPSLTSIEHAFRDPPGRGDQEHEGAVGGCVGQGPGRIADIDAAGGRG